MSSDLFNILGVRTRHKLSNRADVFDI